MTDEKLEVRIERKTELQYYNWRTIKEGFWVYAPDSRDRCRAEPDNSGYEMALRAVFYKEPSNDCFLLLERGEGGPVKVLGAISSAEKANEFLLARAEKSAKEGQEYFRRITQKEIPIVYKID